MKQQPGAYNATKELLQSAARRVIERCAEIGSCSDRPGEVTRLFCTPAMRAAHGKLRGWMETLGLECRTDAAGNLVGRWNGRRRSPGDAAAPKALLIGSHLDSVVNAGKYDGVLGVIIGLAMVELAIELNADLPFAIDVVGFSEEEGVRFSTPYIGSRAIVGELDDTMLEQKDSAGVSVADALRAFACDPAKLTDCVYTPQQVIAFIEPHIEQGPVLELQDLAVGMVTGIAGQTRACLRFTGRAGHAGTVPMAARQDALATAAELILAVERIARGHNGMVATVGQLEVSPNASNVIAGEVQLRLDTRHADDQTRELAVREILGEAKRIADARGLSFDLVWRHDHNGSQFDPEWLKLMELAIREAGQRPIELASGAGHDALIVSRRFNTAMLFIRCKGGVSHHPDESVTEADVAIALDVLYRFLMRLADQAVTTTPNTSALAASE